MDAVDVSEHHYVASVDEAPTLLAVVLDTNPRAWDALGDRLPLSQAISSILVFLNAHLASGSANDVAIVAAHVNRAVWLFPSPTLAPSTAVSGNGPMGDAPSGLVTPPPASSNKHQRFAEVQHTILSSVRKLMNETVEENIDQATTRLSGALTLALCRINKIAQGLTATAANPGNGSKPTTDASSTMKGRVVVISVSDSEPSQYIPTMNAVFAAAYTQVTIDTLALAGDVTFLQQACFSTDGCFLSVSHPEGFLSYLMFGLAADAQARKSTVAPTHGTVDFRAACFCHGTVVDVGFVCSICLSIFCDPPENAECLTCGTKLALGIYGSKPAVVSRKRKKRNRITNGSNREGTGGPTGTSRS